jgi:hypothetical protein
MITRRRVQKSSAWTPINDFRLIGTPKPVTKAEGKPKPSTPAQLPEPAGDAMAFAGIAVPYVAADRRPITLSASELAESTGLTGEEVIYSIASPERLEAHPTRARPRGIIPLFSRRRLSHGHPIAR